MEILACISYSASQPSETIRLQTYLQDASVTILRLVPPKGNAPLSSGYQPGALLLSYRGKLYGAASGVEPLRESRMRDLRPYPSNTA